MSYRCLMHILSSKWTDSWKRSVCRIRGICLNDKSFCVFSFIKSQFESLFKSLWLFEVWTGREKLRKILVLIINQKVFDWRCFFLRWLIRRICWYQTLLMSGWKSMALHLCFQILISGETLLFLKRLLFSPRSNLCYTLCWLQFVKRFKLIYHFSSEFVFGHFRNNGSFI